jgi:hypothetical protein
MKNDRLIIAAALILTVASFVAVRTHWIDNSWFIWVWLAGLVLFWMLVLRDKETREAIFAVIIVGGLVLAAFGGLSQCSFSPSPYYEPSHP